MLKKDALIIQDETGSASTMEDARPKDSDAYGVAKAGGAIAVRSPYPPPPRRPVIFSVCASSPTQRSISLS